MRRVVCAIACAIAGLAAFTPAYARTKPFSARSVGSLVQPGCPLTGIPDGIWGNAINNRGQVVGAGYYCVDDTSFEAFVWDSGQLTGLGWLPPVGFLSEATAINNEGVTAGWSSSVGNLGRRAVIFREGRIIDLGTLVTPPGPCAPNDFDCLLFDSYATGINNAGTVVGYSQASREFVQKHAFVYTDGTMRDLGTLGGSESYAFGINASGVIVGKAQTASGAWHAFAFSRGTMVDIGAALGFAAGDSEATAINESGEIVGHSALGAFLYRRGRVVRLGAFTPLAINNKGTIVGSDGTNAVVYGKGSLCDLNDLVPEGTLHLTYADAINRRGQIVAATGSCCEIFDRGFSSRTYVLTGGRER